MPAVFKRTLVKIGGSFRLTIPAEIVEGFGWKEGQVLELVLTDSKVVIQGPKK